MIITATAYRSSDICGCLCTVKHVFLTQNVYMYDQIGSECVARIFFYQIYLTYKIQKKMCSIIYEYVSLIVQYIFFFVHSIVITSQ